jgi:hypothetical protein
LYTTSALFGGCMEAVQSSELKEDDVS